jgi:hypothetical protein
VCVFRVSHSSYYGALEYDSCLRALLLQQTTLRDECYRSAAAVAAAGTTAVAVAAAGATADGM